MKKILLPLVLVVYVSLLFFFAVYQHVETLGSFTQYDKAIHFGEFFVFTLLLWLTLAQYKVKLNYVWTVFVAVFVALLSEWVQRFVPSRTSSLFDFLADVAGIGLALLLVYLVKKWIFGKHLS